MVELGAIAGIPVVAILTCLLKCAVEVGNVDEHPDEVQNLLYLQCLADCLLPSGLPDPDRYKTDEKQEHSTSSQSDKDENSDSSGEENTVSDEETSFAEIDGSTVRLHVEFRRNITTITIEDSNIREKYRNDDFKDIYHPNADLTPKIESLAQDVLNTTVDVSTDAFSISIVAPDLRRETISTFREQLIDLLRDESNP